MNVEELPEDAVRGNAPRNGRESCSGWLANRNGQAVPVSELRATSLLKDELGIRLAYPTYRVGLEALWQAGEGR